MPEGLWLTEIKQTGSSVQIDGRATSITSITDFTQQLQNSGYFQRPVEILSTATEMVEDTEVVRFSVKADAVQAQSPGDTAAGPAPSSAMAGGAPGTPGV